MSEETSRIQVLDDRTINKIAAGEVVERPAAIIRELVENAIDAGADDLRVELEQGGIKLIRIQDNGCGMTQAEAELSLQRHATSKIRSDDDLFNIQTLGFRGEAVPSIAAVSRFEMMTRTHDTPVGTKVIVHGGNQVAIESTGCTAGTTITVRNLFYNVPARQKFLRAAGTEYSHCLEAVIREMLIRPHIDVEVKHNRQQVLRAPKTDCLKTRAVKLLGAHWGAVIPIDFENDCVKITGLISPVGVHRGSSANATYLYVNNRFVQDTAVRRAVKDAYQGIIPKGRFPLVLLCIEVAPSEVDVNVHPAKTEVRFQQVLDVGRSITLGLRNAMQEHGIRREVTTQQKPTPLPRNLGETLPLFGTTPVGSAQSTPAVTPLVHEPSMVPLPALPPLPPLPTESSSVTGTLGAIDDVSLRTEPNVDGAQSDAQAPVLQVDERPFPSSFYSWSTEDTTTQPVDPMQVPAAMPMDAFGFTWPEYDESEGVDVSLGDLLPVAKFSDLRIIGQLKKTYILCEGEGELVIIDQHAAHERITLDAIQRRRMDFIGGFQQLLTPILIEVTPAQLARLQPLLPMFAEFGLEMDEFGGNTVRIRQIPTILENNDWDRLVHDLVDDVMAGGRGSPIYERLELALATRACHGSIRAGRSLSKFEMQEILDDLDEVDFGVCAHGRPVAIRVSPAELEKRFHRA